MLTFREMQNYFCGPSSGLRDIFWIEAGVKHRLRSMGKQRDQARVRQLPRRLS